MIQLNKVLSLFIYLWFIQENAKLWHIHYFGRNVIHLTFQITLLHIKKYYRKKENDSSAASINKKTLLSNDDVATCEWLEWKAYLYRNLAPDLNPLLSSSGVFSLSL